MGCGVLDSSLEARVCPKSPISPPSRAALMRKVRVNDREDHLEQARRNARPLPIDAESRGMARGALEQALARGRIDEGLYWQNDDDASGYA